MGLTGATLVRSVAGGGRGALVALVAALSASPLLTPQLLAFPHSARSGDSLVWAERPLDQAELDRIVARAEALVAASPLAREREPRRIFLTDGGWRWTWLANVTRGSFALTRALTDPVVIVNRSDLAGDAVVNGVGARRRLSSVIAHETTHVMLRRRFGRIAMAGKPQWLVEGYCDYIARESSLDAREAAALESRGERHPALLYYHGRRRVAAMLTENGGDVEELFAAH